MYFQTFRKDFNGIWLGKICEMLISSTPFAELFTLDSRQRKHVKTGLLRHCLFKQNNISKDGRLKTRQQSRRKKKDVQVRECNLIPMSISPLYDMLLDTRNTCMQQRLAYIFQTLFQHEVFVITPTLNAGSRCTSCYSWQHDTCFLIFCTDLQN